MPNQTSLAGKYRQNRAAYVANGGKKVIDLEQHYADKVSAILLAAAPTIHVDFNRCMELRPFWENYAPEQRGRQPTGESIPWGDV